MDEKLDKKILDVPHLSQLLDVSKDKWQKTSCGVTALAMVTSYYLGNDSPTIDELIDEGVLINGYDKEFGWKHSSLVVIARNHGLHGYQQEFKSREKSSEDRLTLEGIEKIKKVILNNIPVLVSVKPFFRKNKASHFVVLIGLKMDGNKLTGFYYNDPESEEKGDGEHEFVALERFLEYWRKMAIFISRRA